MFRIHVHRIINSFEQFEIVILRLLIQQNLHMIVQFLYQNKIVDQYHYRFQQRRQIQVQEQIYQ
jgi:hypothetical protein